MKYHKKIYKRVYDQTTSHNVDKYTIVPSWVLLETCCDYCGFELDSYSMVMKVAYIGKVVIHEGCLERSHRELEGGINEN